MSPPRVSAVIFDVGGTLVDESRVIGLWADRLGVGRTEFFASLGAVIDRREHHGRVFEVARPGFVPDGGARLTYDHGDLFGDVRSCLKRLKTDGFVVGVAANQPRETEAFLGGCDLALDFITSSEGWGVSKPDPAFFERLVEEVSLPPAEIAYVGDRVDNDVLPAVEAGLVSVFIRRGPWGFVHATWPEAERAHARIETLDELPGALGNLGSRR